MKHILTIILITMSFTGSAFVIWPNASAPCNGTLQACIDASSEGEYIEIRTNSSISENISTTTALSLVAGMSYKPSFSAGNSLMINTNLAAGSATVSIKGLTFTQGGIKVSTSGFPVDFNIENNTFLATQTNIPAIEVVSNSSYNSFINIKFNDIVTETIGDFNFAYGAIHINKNGVGLGAIDGEIYNNTIKAEGQSSKGISLYTSNNANMDINITANVIYGGPRGGIFINRYNSTSATSTFDISSNAFYRLGTFYFSSGIYIINDTGTTNADIVNNTIIQSVKGVYLRNGAGTFNANINNNLIAYAITGFDLENSVSVSNDYNLYFDNDYDSGYTPGANAINADPQLMSLQNARLRMGSPALEAGDSFVLLLVADAPFVDADGLLRIKNSANVGSGTVDIGAYESGDKNFIHTSTTSSSYISVIDHSETNSLPNLKNLHITANWNPNNSAGIYNNANEALYYTSNRWRIFNEDQATNVFLGSSFNVSKFASSSETFKHVTSSSGSNNTTINRSGLDGFPDKILQVSQHWISNVYNNNPPGVLYFGGKWVISNLNSQNIPINSNFNVYYQDKSKSAYEHIATTANIISNRTYLDNSLINGIACAQIQVTQAATQGVFNGSPIGVFYENGQWAIFNQNIATMPEGAAFHVLINPEQIAECTDLIYKSSFE